MRNLRGLRVLVLLLVAGGAARASAQVEVSALVRTETAVYFQPVAQPGIVWYVPFAETRLFPVEPSIPDQNYWRAAIALKQAPAVRPGELRADWQGKALALVPYVLRPSRECTFTRLPETRFVQQEVRAAGRDVSAGSTAPVCQFSFKLPATVPPELLVRAAAGTLIAYELPLSLTYTPSVSWETVYLALVGALGDAAVRPLPPEAALAAARRALAAPGLAGPSAEMSAAEQDALCEAILTELFAPALDEGEGEEPWLLLVGPPAGALVYHRELITIAL